MMSVQAGGEKQKGGVSARSGEAQRSGRSGKGVKVQYSIRGKGSVLGTDRGE